MKYDVVIIGSGLGGLQCGYILSQEGYNVCVLEKNRQLGGCLQTFRRNNTIFDTGMHYIGSMDDGQILNNLFRYFRLTGKLRLKRMDEDGYDIVKYKDREYKFAMGYDRFIETMLQYFPKEREALMKYVAKLKEISQSVDLFNLREKSYQLTGYLDFFSVGFDDFLNSITKDADAKKRIDRIIPALCRYKGTGTFIFTNDHSFFIHKQCIPLYRWRITDQRPSCRIYYRKWRYHNEQG